MTDRPTGQPVPDPDAEARRQQILAMKPEDRALLARIMRGQLDAITAQITLLEIKRDDTTRWLAEFDTEAGEQA